MAAGKILVASQSFVLWDAGRMVRFRRNRTTIREGHRLLEGNEQRFRPLTVDFELEDPRPEATPEPVAPPAPPAPVAPELVTDEQRARARKFVDDNNRDALNALAVTLGIADAERYESKSDLAAAIVIAEGD